MLDIMVDDGLMRVMRHGKREMPNDLARLRTYLEMVSRLLSEKAREVEPDWALAEAAIAEIETLQMLETQVAEKVASLHAETLIDIQNKLVIWELLNSLGDDGEEESGLTQLVGSIKRDLDNILRGPEAKWRGRQN